MSYLIRKQIKKFIQLSQNFYPLLYLLSAYPKGIWINSSSLRVFLKALTGQQPSILKLSSVIKEGENLCLLDHKYYSGCKYSVPLRRYCELTRLQYSRYELICKNLEDISSEFPTTKAIIQEMNSKLQKLLKIESNACYPDMTFRCFLHKHISSIAWYTKGPRQFTREELKRRGLRDMQRALPLDTQMFLLALKNLEGHEGYELMLLMKLHEMFGERWNRNRLDRAFFGLWGYRIRIKKRILPFTNFELDDDILIDIEKVRDALKIRDSTNSLIRQLGFLRYKL